MLTVLIIRFLLLVLIIFVSSFYYVVKAQIVNDGKSYQYDSFIVNIKINQDSTFTVEERQIYNYKGNFHQAFRIIPFNKFDLISDILVIDGKTNRSLNYSGSKLNKLSPSSWGKFTYYKESGYQYIEWYYNLTDTTYEWIVKYKVHGGLEFNKVSDRLYWNIFSNFDVPIKSAQVNIFLPGNFAAEQVPIYAYRTSKKDIEQKYTPDDRLVSLASLDFASKEAFTIDVSWPKGVVSEAAYWVDFYKIYWGYVFATVIFLTSLITIFFFWLFREKLPKGKGTIIPEYKPPEDLRPAMAEVIVKEGLTTKGLTATVIDLAVRGYLKIQEQKKSYASPYVVLGVSIVSAAILIFFITGVSVVLMFVIALLIFSTVFIRRFSTTDYILNLTKPYMKDPNLFEYEKSYLGLIFRLDSVFSTKKLRESSNSTKKEFYEGTQKIKDQIYQETETKTKAYDIGLIKEKRKTQILIAIAVITFILIFVQLKANLSLGQTEILIISCVVSLLALWSYISFEARLNKQGRILKEEWLGFKLYLETAEKYRLQKLTPDAFEKYLPYAMIFGVEKNWAKAFESLNMPAPVWYHRGYYGGYGGNISYTSGSSFSPSLFSASFASSFNSSFSSSGGGGGGGGAGGGGGGGGGGAS